MRKFIIIIFALAVFAGIIYFIQSKKADEVVPTPVPQVVDEQVLVEQYVRANIKTLAPETPVLGGSWYITSVIVEPTTNTGAMVYEDGHIEGSATFTYTIVNTVVTLGNIKSTNKDSARVEVGYVKGHVTIGPFCPVERVDEPCKVPPEAYTSREAVIYLADKVTITKRVHLDTNGNYQITLPPGSYFAQIAPAGIGQGEKKPLTIKSTKTTVVDFDIDTGIR